MKTEVGNRMRTAIAQLPPGYFSLIMATGIVSIASQSAGFGTVATALFRLNIVLYVILWVCNCARIIIHARLMAEDLCSHVRGPGFFTMIAGTCVLGAQFALFRDSSRMAVVLLFAGIGLWVVLLSVVFTALIVKTHKPSLSQGINGTWLVATVATESISVLACLVAAQFPFHREWLIFMSLCMFLVGGMLYFVIITFIAYQFLFTEMPASNIAPAYWINMGALAITALAGGSLAAAAPGSALIHLLFPFVLGIAVASWAGASCWILLLLVLGAWRHAIKRVRIAYSYQYWGMVFPLGMYTACTFQVAKFANLSFLFVIPRYAIFVALIAWSLTFIGLIHSLGVLVFGDNTRDNFRT